MAFVNQQIERIKTDCARLRAAMLEQVKGHSALLIQSNHFAVHKRIFGKRRTGSRQAGKVLIE